MERGGKGGGVGGGPPAEEEEGALRWEDLVREALVDIFARMEFEDRYRNVGRVCKAWRDAVREPPCWEDVDMEPSFERRRESSAWWGQEFERRMDATVRTVVDWGASRLRRLRTRHCSDEAIAYISARCPNLRCLQIQMSPNVTDKSMALLATSCPKLESMDLSECRGVSAETLRMLGANCSGLTHLKRNMLDISGNCLRRSTIPLRYVHSLPAGDQEVSVIAKSMPQLRHLELCFSTIHDQCLVLLAAGCQKLEYLDLRGCNFLTNRGMDEAEKQLSSFVRFVRPDRNLLIERYGHWQLYDNRFSHQFLEF